MKIKHRDKAKSRIIVGSRLEGEPESPRSPSNSPFVPSIPSAVEDGQ